MSVCVLQNLEKKRVLWTDVLASRRFSVSKIGPEPAKPMISLTLNLRIISFNFDLDYSFCSSVQSSEWFSFPTYFITRNKVLTAKHVKQGYRYHKIRKAFSIFFRRHFDLVSKYSVGLKTLPLKSLSEPELYDDWLVCCFGFNGPLKQYFSLYRAVSQREGERGEKG